MYNFITPLFDEKVSWPLGDLQPHVMYFLRQQLSRGPTAGKGFKHIIFQNQCIMTKARALLLVFGLQRVWRACWVRMLRCNAHWGAYGKCAIRQWLVGGCAVQVAWRSGIHN